MFDIRRPQQAHSRFTEKSVQKLVQKTLDRMGQGVRHTRAPLNAEPIARKVS